MLPTVSEVDEFRGTLTVELKRANSGAAEPKKKSKPSGLKKLLRAKSKKSQDTSEESLPDLGLDNSYQTYSFHLKILKEQVQFQHYLCFAFTVFKTIEAFGTIKLWDNKNNFNINCVSPLQFSKLLKHLKQKNLKQFGLLHFILF